MVDPPRPATLFILDFHVGAWLAEPALDRLTSGTTVLHVRPQLMDILVCLARHQGRVVATDELRAEVWPDRIIDESVLTRNIEELRRMLGDESQAPRYIETVAKGGYRLIAPVEWIEERGELGRVPVARSHQIEQAVPTRPSGTSAVPRTHRPRLAITAVVVMIAVATLVTVLVTRRAPKTVLSDRDPVMLAFENRTGDAGFDDPLPLALAIQLEQSPFLQIVGSDRVRRTLTLMGRPPDTSITRQLGLEICERVGATALIVASLTRLAQEYAIGLEAVACPTGDAIGRQQVQVASKDAVLGGLAQAASRLRLGLGESLASVNAYDTPVVEATTSSLEALRALRQGDLARDRGDNAEALRLYREAVARDPEFALAHLRVGTYGLSMHYEQEAVPALERAYALRDRVTFPERLEIDLLYHAGITGDQNRVTLALETMRRVYPRRLSARRRLAAQYLNIGRFEESMVEALAAQELEPGTALAISAVARAYFALNRLAEARGAAEEAIARSVDNETHHALLLQIGFLSGDARLVERERAWAATHDEATPYFTEAEAEEAVWRGRLRESLAQLDRYQGWALRRGAEHRWIVLELRKARFEALCGYSARASARVARQLARRDLGHDFKIEALKVAVSAGDVRRVQELIAALDRAGWPRTEQPFAGFLLSYRAALETDRGNPDRAIELLEPMVPVELGVLWGLIPLHERARAHLLAGHWDQARGAYEKMLAHPGVVSGQKLLPLAQLGVARAWAGAGRVVESRSAYEAFLTLWKDADPDLPLLAQARRERAALERMPRDR